MADCFGGKYRIDFDFFMLTLFDAFPKDKRVFLVPEVDVKNYFISN